jgi:hypothetical protein
MIVGIKGIRSFTSALGMGVVVASLVSNSTAATIQTSRPLAELINHNSENAWLAAYDPTLISNRVYNKLSYEQLDGDASQWRLESSVRGAVQIHENLALGIQLMIPTVWASSPDPTTGLSDTSSGLGDIEFKIGLMGRLAPNLRWAAGFDSKFATASSSALGSYAFELRPIAAISWDLAEGLNMGITADYRFNPFYDDGGYESALEIKFPLGIKISDSLSAVMTGKGYFDFADTTQRANFEVAFNYAWGSRKQYAMTLGAEFPLSNQSEQWKTSAAFAWYY